MPKDMTSIRHDRLSKVMAFLQSRVRASHDEIYSVGGYNSERTFQNDLYYLRGVYRAEIIYDCHKKLYVMENTGFFYLDLKITKSEIEALTAGLKMAVHFLPHLEKSADSLWEKLSNYIPQEIISLGSDIVKSTMMASPVAEVNVEIFNTLLDAKHNKKLLVFSMLHLKKCLNNGYYRHMIFISEVTRGIWYRAIVNIKISEYTE